MDLLLSLYAPRIPLQPVGLNDLASLDPVTYRNLLFLKTYSGDVESLSLDFTVADNALGVCACVREQFSPKRLCLKFLSLVVFRSIP